MTLSSDTVKVRITLQGARDREAGIPVLGELVFSDGTVVDVSDAVVDGSVEVHGNQNLAYQTSIRFYGPPEFVWVDG